MKNSKWTLCLLGFILTFAITGSAADTLALKFTFTKANVRGALYTQPAGISNAGVIVGNYGDVGGEYGYGYILDGKKLTKIIDPKGWAGGTTVQGINPDGAVSVVGEYQTSRKVGQGKIVGFLYKDGKYTDIPGPSGTELVGALGINDSGAVVGYYEDTAGVHGYLLQGNKYTTLDVPGAVATFATGINKTGKIVLFWIDSSGNAESSLYDGKTYTTINVPGVPNSLAWGINAAGDVIYEWEDAILVTHGALLHSGKYYKFDYPNSTNTNRGNAGINDKGDIVGSYDTISHGADSLGYKATYK
jgi:uncharacterized membrane protein